MVLGIDPDNIKAHYRRGWARLKLRTPNVKGGKEDLARVLSQEPGNKAVSGARTARCACFLMLA